MRSAAVEAIQAMRSRVRGRREGNVGLAVVWSELAAVPERLSIANARSWVEWKRRSGFFSRHLRTIFSNGKLIFAFISLNSGGSSFSIAVIVSAIVSRRNAR